MSRGAAERGRRIVESDVYAPTPAQGNEYRHDGHQFDVDDPYADVRVEPDSDVELDPDAGFWSQRTILEHVRDFAYSRSAAPFATLACVLRRANSLIEPNVMLPPIIGGPASVNLFTVTTGRSGQGKDAANAAGFDAVKFPELDSFGAPSGDYYDEFQPSIGSGEGLARLFKGHKQKDGTFADKVTRAHLIVPEVNTLAALAGRRGSTLETELLKAYMGQSLGFQNAAKETTTVVAAHSYRLCLGIGAQPENAAFFFDRGRNGLPQRLVWLSSVAPHAPAPSDRIKPVAPKTVVLPNFGIDAHEIAVPPSVHDEIVAHRHLVLIGSDQVDPLDGHLMLTRLKVSFALALLEGRKYIVRDDWDIAGQLMDMSTKVRAQMRGAVDAARRQQNAAKAFDQAEREAIIAERLSEDRLKRVAKAITNKLKRAARASRYELRMSCHSSIRADFPTVFDLFLDNGFIVCCEGGEGDVEQYEFGPEHRG